MFFSKILTAKQMHSLDAAIIDREGITTQQLIERAAQNLSVRIMQRFPDTKRRFMIFCGGGNNGGDGLAISRIMYAKGYDVECFELKSGFEIPLFKASDIIIDAIFGSGLNRPIEGFAAEVVKAINNSGCYVISIDIPSGLKDDAIASDADGAVVKADLTLTIESPFLSLLMPENYDYVGEFEIVPLAVDDSEMAYFDTDYHYVTLSDAKKMYRPRGKFAHKGTFGHTLIMAGAEGKAGAAVMCAKACHRAGSGLVTEWAPSPVANIMQVSSPETMVETMLKNRGAAESLSLDKFSAIGIGPGIGTEDFVVDKIVDLLGASQQTRIVPIVLDADALNITARHPAVYNYLPPSQTIFTPHPKEFERLFGKTNNSIERLALLSQKAKEHNIIIVLKGAHTAIADPDGNIYFNSTGNPGMATAGSGDVLTGVISALLSQKYPPLHAAILGVFAHGLAGDIAAQKIGMQGVIASDIIDALPLAFKKIAEN
ncbi:MAG: NAD(P)H-hydrate dehydratase [Bacteroidales bacterium]|nr:NAD(P)H-hydrate dehydratase [Bacteroidales bacterium]